MVIVRLRALIFVFIINANIMEKFVCYINDWNQIEQSNGESVSADIAAVLTRVNEFLATPAYVSTLNDLLTHFRTFLYFDRNYLTTHRDPELGVTLIVDHYNRVVGAVDSRLELPYEQTEVDFDQLLATIKNPRILDYYAVEHA